MRASAIDAPQANAALNGAIQPTAIFPVTVGYGGCSRCACPEFFGGSSECDRGGCGHHYDDHN